MHTYKITAVFANSHWMVKVTEDNRRIVWYRSNNFAPGEMNTHLDMFCSAQRDAQRMIQVYKRINTAPQFTACYEHEDKLAAMGVEV